MKPQSVQDGKGAWVGIDVAKKSCEVMREGDAGPRTFGRSRSGLRALARWLKQKPIAGIVVEATGGYERMVVEAIEEKGLRPSLVNPRQVRDFAKASGHLAKTDRLDARVLARYGKVFEPAPSPRNSPENQRLSALLLRREHLVAMKVAE
jgi:transposase